MENRERPATPVDRAREHAERALAGDGSSSSRRVQSGAATTSVPWTRASRRSAAASATRSGDDGAIVSTTAAPTTAATATRSSASTRRRIAVESGTVILENGVVRTLDPSLPTACALAIAGERIVGGVGVHETALASPEVVDLRGRCVVPGFTDSTSTTRPGRSPSER